MKVLAIVFLCAFVAVQGRHAGVQSTSAVAALGENPYVVHLRYAVGTSGLLGTCVGSLIGSSWVLTSASCLSDIRFIWVRYGVVDVISPSLVTETSAATVHPQYDPATGANNIGLISVNRMVHSTDNIGHLNLAVSDVVPASGKFCGFGENDSAPGEQLSCFDLSLEAKDDGFIAASGDGVVSQFDIGAPVVSQGVQVGIVVGAGAEASVLAVSSYVGWIGDVSGIVAQPIAAAESDDVHAVNFVN